jgi:HEXXH motif-containing protein
MTLDRYELPDEQFRSLARGTGDPAAIALLTESQLARRRLFLLAAEDRLGPALELVERVERESPEAARDLLRHPFLDAWFRALIAGDPGAEPYFASLAAAAAIRGGVPFELKITVTGPDLVLPSLGTALGVGPGPVPVRYDGAEMQIAGESWRPASIVPLAGGAWEILDADPMRDRYPAPPLPPGEAAGFAEVLAAGWELLAAEQPEHAEAMRVALRGLVPLRAPDDGWQISAAVRGCFGAIGMSVPPDAETAAELLIHEFQHDKLGALLDLVELAAEDGPARYHAPWRPDPRPAAALMQGVYAFAGVAGFWRVHRKGLTGAGRERADGRFAYWYDQVRYGTAQLLAADELNPLGRRFFAELDAELAGWADEVPSGTIRLRAATTHIAWRLVHFLPDPDDVDALADAWLRGEPCPAELSEPGFTGDATPWLVLKEALEEPGSVGLTEAERAIVGGDPERALRLLSRPGSDREWTAAAVALHAAGASRSAYRRPDLLRAVYERTPTGDAVALARWMT